MSYKAFLPHWQKEKSLNLTETRASKWRYNFWSHNFYYFLLPLPMFYTAKGHRTDAAAKLSGLVNEVSFCREKQKEVRRHEWIHFRSQM